MPETMLCPSEEAYAFISSSCAIFRSASQEIFTRHAGKTVDCHVYAPGELISSPSPEAKHNGIGIIRSGTASVYSGDDCRRVLLRFISEGGLYGVSSLFSASPQPTRIIAESKCRVLDLPREAVRGMLHEDAALLDAYLEFMSGRILFLNRKISCLSGGCAERRLALHLLTLSDAAGAAADDGGKDVVLNCSFTELSRLLDIGRASLYRAFDALDAAGGARRGDGRHIRVYPAILEAAFLSDT